MGQRGQHRQRHTYVWVNAVNTGNAILMYGSTRSTQAMPYLCMGQRGQHMQRHTYVWVNMVNTGNAILMCGSTQATPYLCVGQRGQHRHRHTGLYIYRSNTSNTIQTYCNTSNTIQTYGNTTVVWTVFFSLQATDGSHNIYEGCSYSKETMCIFKEIIVLLSCFMNIIWQNTWTWASCHGNRVLSVDDPGASSGGSGADVWLVGFLSRSSNETALEDHATPQAERCHYCVHTFAHYEHPLTERYE